MLSKKALISAVVLVGTVTANAQISTNSPYTRFGLGDLSDQVFANNAAMGGIGYGLRDKNIINTLNPASYSAVDSLSFMFDVGVSLTSSNFKENGFNSNAKNSSFDYLAMQFRLHPKLGIAFGFLPYSNVGYSFYNTKQLNQNEDITITNTHTGEGGLHQVFGGLGFKILDNLSVGANIGYLYGALEYTTTASFNTTADASIMYNKIRVNTYKADFGIQYTQKFNNDNSFTLGVVYGLGHKINSKETKRIQVTDNSSYSTTNDTLVYDGYGMPTTIGLGLVYNYTNKLTIGVDYNLQKWSKELYNNEKGAYNDRHRYALGAEYLPNPLGRSYLKRIRYRAGIYYTTSYLKLPTGNNGPAEYGVSAGFGLPLNLFQRNSILNITGQYVHVKPSVSNMLSENRFVLKLGLTFNERWFMKWKVN